MLNTLYPPSLPTSANAHHLAPIAKPPYTPLPDQDTNDEILQRHYARMQQTLLSAVDKQMETVESRLNETEVELKRTEGTKKEIGVELYKAKKEIGRMNGRVERMKFTVEQTQDERNLMKSDLEALEREMNQLIRTNEASRSTLQQTVEENQASIIDSTTKISQLGEVNAAYHSDIKVQRRVQEKLRKELEASESKRKAAEGDLENIRKEREELLKMRRELEETLRAQRGETSMAQVSINKMHREITDLNSQQKMITKQWEESIAAMAKRDQAFQAVESNRETIKSKLDETEKVNRALKTDVEKREDELSKKEHENASLSALLATVRTNLINVDSKAREARNALVEAQVAESLYKQELDKVSKRHELTKEELHRRNESVSELKWRIDSMKNDFDIKMKDEIFMHVARKEEQVNATAASQLRAIEREHEGKTINLRHSNAELQMMMIAQKEELRHARHERDAYRDRFNEINAHYGKLYDESKYLIYALERKEHDVNYLKSKIQEKTLVDQTRPLQMAMQKLQKDLHKSRNENDKLQKMWLEGQKEGLKGKERSAKLEEDSVFMKTQLHINDAIKQKTAGEIADAKKEAIEQKLEAAKLFSELRKLQPVVDELTEKNVSRNCSNSLHLVSRAERLTMEQKVVLELQLEEARLRLQESQVNSETSTQMLKHEIRRLYSERSQTLQARLLDDRATHALERKHVVAKEIAERLKSERTDLQKQNWDLRKRVSELESLVKELKMVGGVTIVGKRFGFIASTELSYERVMINALHRATPITQSQRAAWVSVPGQAGTVGGRGIAGKSSGNNQSPSPHPDGELDDVPDFEAWRLKIESLSSERQYLMNDNDLLRSKVDDLNVSLTRQTRNQTDNAVRIKQLEQTIKTLQQQLRDLQGRCARAERVAACLEKQFKDAKPNTKIDYQMLTEAEPSTQLLAALMSRDRDVSLPAPNAQLLPPPPNASGQPHAVPTNRQSTTYQQLPQSQGSGMEGQGGLVATGSR
ncbi:hypothetical protein HDV00_006488 [Rhizophlyctis rosea]|nr:hypothetical protein HDV00_006488 [Rhizophlyctis rosea]